ncbi:MAG: response regulator [Myxococcota bacterium]
MTAAPPHSEPASLLPGLRILVIDDERAIHDDIRRVLKTSYRTDEDLAALEALLFNGNEDPSNQGSANELPECEILSEYQGQDAVQRLEQELGQGRRFDLAIVDMRMPPGWDGLRTVEELWKRDESLPVAFCTAYSDHTVEQVAQRLDRDSIPWLSKPFHSQQLKDIVRRHARGAG